MTTIYTVNNKVLKNSANDKWLTKKAGLPVIPANTIRVRTSDGNVPIKGSYATYETATLVTGTTDIYDVYKSGTSFYRLLRGSTNVVEVIGTNISNITSLDNMFSGCSNLRFVSLFDTSNVTNMTSMFYGCTSLTSVPLFDTSNVTSMYWTFFDCVNVESGALALYQQASTQANPPSDHTYTFYNCGSNTTTGAAELAQIPSDWK